MPFADVNGQHIYFADSGGGAPAVVFSHGFLMDHEMFAPQVEELSAEFRCITWDERGFGQTPATAPFTYYDSAGPDPRGRPRSGALVREVGRRPEGEPVVALPVPRRARRHHGPSR